MKSCLIVGGGLIGMLTAKELVDAGVEVTLLDKQAVGEESSWAGGGILSPLYPWRYADEITHLAKWSQQYYPMLCQQLLEQTGIDPQLTASGLLMLNVEDGDLADAWADRFGYELQHPSLQSLLAKEPSLAALDGENNILLPQVGQIRNPRLLASLRAWLVLKGVRLLEHHAMSKLLIEHNQVLGVMCGEQALYADSVVIAGGAWSRELLATAGVDVNIFPVQGQMLLFKTQPGLIKHIIMRGGFYLIPRQDGHILAGSSMEYRGFDKQTTAVVYEQLKKVALSLVPDLADAPIVKHWAGLRPGSEKGIPIIGAISSLAGLYVNTGHFRNGVVMGPATARLLVDIMLKREAILSPTLYSPA